MKYKFKKNGISVDLSGLEEQINSLMFLSNNAQEIVTEAGKSWAESTENLYCSKISYGNGFRRANPRYRGLTAFSNAQPDGNKGVKMEVGHENFIAKFLEVGTSSHKIPGRGEKPYTVGGIQGSGALKKAVEQNLPTLIDGIEDQINKKLK